jgi:hypothetical protein
LRPGQAMEHRRISTIAAALCFVAIELHEHNDAARLARPRVESSLPPKIRPPLTVTPRPAES